MAAELKEVSHPTQPLRLHADAGLWAPCGAISGLPRKSTGDVGPSLPEGTSRKKK